MTRDEMESAKGVANEIYSIFKKHEQGLSSYDRCLEDIAYELVEFHNRKPIIGYIMSGTIRTVLEEIVQSKKQDEKETYKFNCKIHQNDMEV